jgi:hypothetical protein
MQFIQLSAPPRDTGMMCSRVRSSAAKRAAVGADEAVAGEQLGVGQGRAAAPGPRGHGTAHRDDGMDLDARLQARGALHTAAHHMAGLAQGPGNGVTGVEDGGFLDRHPRLGAPRHVQLQHIHDVADSFSC